MTDWNEMERELMALPTARLRQVARDEGVCVPLESPTREELAGAILLRRRGREVAA